MVYCALAYVLFRTAGRRGWTALTREALYERVYALAAAIPYGRVATYGQLAFLAGVPRGGRLAGQAMARVPGGRDVPCHRVVNSRGCCAPGFAEQRGLLEGEGVAFLKDGRVDMRRHLWNPAAGPKNGLE